jgi:hypothetical protein
MAVRPLRTRQVFHDAVEAFVHWDFFTHSDCPEPPVWFDDEHGEIPLSRACGLVWNCTNRMSSELRVRIACLAGEPFRKFPSYACGARALLRLVKWRKSMKTASPRASTALASDPSSAADEAMNALTEIFSK